MSHDVPGACLICAPAFLLLLLTQGGPTSKPAPDDGAPPLRFELAVNGRTHPVETDRPFEIEIGGKKVKMRLTALPHRVFDREGIRFHYPAAHAWKMDVSTPGVTIYTLAGSEDVLIVMKYGDGLDAARIRGILVDTMTAQYGGAENVRQSAVALELAGQRVAGVRLDVTIAGQKMRQDVYALDTRTGPVGLVIQDSGDDGGASAETKRATELLQKTFELRSR